MFQQLLTSWAQIVTTYFVGAFSLLEGGFHPLSLLPVIGILCLVAGTALAIYWNEPRALRLVPLLLVASLTPILLGIADSMLAWVGVAFLILFGLVMMFVWIGVVAADTRRVAVWLIGTFALTLAIYSGLGMAVAG